MTDAEIYPSDELCMAGKELRRLRDAANLSQRQVARRMGWYRKRVERMEQSRHFCLPADDMAALLAALQAPDGETP